MPHHGPRDWLRRACSILAALAAMALPQALGAVTLQATPLRITVDPAHPVALLTLTNQDEQANRDAQDSQIQITLHEWSQPDGIDQLTPTRDLLVNPPIFALAGGTRQVVRLALRAAPGATERSYRVIVQQLPQRPDTAGGSVGTLLRLSIPVFVPPTQRVVQLTWQLRPTASGAALIVRNAGTVHVQVRGLRLTQGGRVVFDRMMSAYVLPGVSRALPIETAAALVAGAPVTIVADTDQGAIQATTTVGAPIHASGSG